MTWIKGILWFFPSLFVFRIIAGFFSISFQPFNYYLYFLCRDHLLFCALGIAGYFLFYRFEHPHDVQDTFLNILTFFAGFFLFVSIADFFTHYGEYNIYFLFILPLLRLFTILVISLLLNKFIEGLGLERIVIGLLLFLVPVCGALISFVYNLNLGLLAFFLSIGLFAGAGAAGYFLKDF
jgi:hypothetical protein